MTDPSRSVLERRVADLRDRTFDVIVVGGGIVGACAALDAAIRGLDVALIEQGDFGHRTSGNSLKIVHGGLRYLQRLDLRRMRESIRERRMWFRVAPHLVDPLPVIVPTYGFGVRNRRLLQLALAVNDAISFDRNQGTAPDRKLPAGRVLSPGEVLDRVPEIPRAGLTGGVVFYDGLMYSPERLTLEVVKAAARHGAVVLNYVGFRDRIWEQQRLAGIVAEDLVGNEAFSVRARTVVNAAGPGVEFVGSRLLDTTLPPPANWSVAVNVLVRGLGHSAAFALGERVDGAGAGRQLFFVPWRGRTMIGTGHYPYTGDPARLLDSDVQSATATFLEELNRAWPGERPFTRDDVLLTHRGLLPARALTPHGSVLLMSRQRIIDHARHGVPGAFTVLAVKYTTGRRVAEQVVDRVSRYLGRGDGRQDPDRFAAAFPTRQSVAALESEARGRWRTELDAESLRHVVRSHGSDFERVLAYRHGDPAWNTRVTPESPVILAQLLHGRDAEMAQTADDLIWRRTELGPCGHASPAVTHTAQAVLDARPDQ